MKRLISFILLSSLIIAINSCNENVNTNAEFRERYVLTSLINCDTSMQAAFITKTYNREITGGDPDIESLFIHGADVKLWFNYDVYQFRDTSIVNENGEVLSFYYNEDLRPTYDQVLEMEALLQNNLLLSSETLVPDSYRLRFTGNSDLIIPPNNSKQTFNYFWTNLGNNIYDPRLIINYLFISDTGAVRMKKAVPVEYIQQGEEYVPIFAQPSNFSGIGFKKDALNRAMAELSEGDENKSNYVVLNAELQLMIYDEYLSSFYSSGHQFLDQFSISLDTPDFTNIKGGLGVFASYISKSIIIEIDKDYIRSFDYGTGQ